MQITISGETHTIDFRYREISAVVEQLKKPTFKEVEEMLGDMGPHNIPGLIRKVILVRQRHDDPKAKGPTLEEIYDALDEDPAKVGEFFTGFAEGYTAMYGGKEVTPDAVETGE